MDSFVVFIKSVIIIRLRWSLNRFVRRSLWTNKLNLSSDSRRNSHDVHPIVMELYLILSNCIYLFFSFFFRQHFLSTMWSRWLISTLQTLLLCKLVNSMPGSSSNFKINPKPCTVNGLDGTCMFVWECIKSEGQHIGMCVDSFMFGSCCAHNLSENAVLPTQQYHQHFDFRPPVKKPRPPPIVTTNVSQNRPQSR